MASPASGQQLNKYRISRRGRKLQVFDDQKTLIALPKDVPERIWAEILQKEENDMIVFDIREEILEEALKIGYEHYMERQTALFTAHIAAQAWLKLIDWHYYRHDPGEDPSAYPPCYIPKRNESWIPDEMPDPSPKDSWSRHELDVLEDTPEDALKKSPSTSSLDFPVIEEIPPEFWFPGKVNLPEEYGRKYKKLEQTICYVTCITQHSFLNSDQKLLIQNADESQEPSIQLAAESEVLQKVTDYSSEELLVQESTTSALKTTTPVEGSLQGAGDSTVARPKKRLTEKSKIFSKPSMLGRSRTSLPPLDIDGSKSRISIISDCRLRNLRVDTQYEVTSEKIDSPPGEMKKRK